ncbi:hypothetical protein F1641_01040 [Quadrisphaera sp. INWT6]|nr:hypothetical protein [Quadrisphaera sp. INWT6]
MRLVRPLAVVALVLVVVGTVVRKAVDAVADRPDLPQTWLAAGARLVDLDAEANVPTWFSTLLLALLAAACAVTGLLLRARGERSWPLLLPALVAAAMSLDELAQLHEDLQLLSERLDLGSPNAFGWVVPGAAVAVGVGVVLLFAARAMAPALRWRLVAAGVVYFAGALGVEVLAGPLYRPGQGDQVPVQSTLYVLSNALEEGLEMAGALVALAAVLALLRVRSTPQGVVVDLARPPLAARGPRRSGARAQGDELRGARGDHGRAPLEEAPQRQR